MKEPITLTFGEPERAPSVLQSATHVIELYEAMNTPSSFDADAYRVARSFIAVHAALAEMEAMYTHAWDRTDGALTIFPDNVPRFDEACRKARIALGRPLYGDNGESDDDGAASKPERSGT